MQNLTKIRLNNGNHIQLLYRSSRRSKRICIRLVPGYGFFELVVPEGTPMWTVRNFVIKNEVWLNERQTKLGTWRPFTEGLEFPFRGQNLLIEIKWHGITEINLHGNRLIVFTKNRNLNCLVTDWIKNHGKKRFTHLCEEKAAFLGKSINRVTVRDTKTRWGSCSSKGNLNFSWRLIMAPDFVSDYLAAHEVAHLACMNHSPKFWAIVKTLTPYTNEARNWLYYNGNSLHFFGGTNNYPRPLA